MGLLEPLPSLWVVNVGSGQGSQEPESRSQEGEAGER
jgi:hypothetical protein